MARWVPPGVKPRKTSKSDLLFGLVMMLRPMIGRLCGKSDEFPAG